MAELSSDPKGLELEDFVAANLVSRGCYVETGIKERNPEDILELDIVWTDYSVEPPIANPVEVKSGDWGLGDVFKFYGWTKYLGLAPGTFVHKERCGRLSQDALDHVAARTGIKFLHLPDPSEAGKLFKSQGLPELVNEHLPEIWRYSFWAQRRLLRVINECMKRGVCKGTLPLAKSYYQLINDGVFFIQDVRERVGELVDEHFEHHGLAASVAYEMESGTIELKDPPPTNTFRKAYFYGEAFPVQTCLYLAHRARLYLLKAIVDYWLSKTRGEIQPSNIKLGNVSVDLTSGRLTPAMATAVEELSHAASFRQFPLFWQVFLWSWGGFLFKDRLAEQYEELSKETGVRQDEIPIALSAFDKLFPVDDGWFREPMNDSRKVLILMPAAMRGIGAYRRLLCEGIKEYGQLGYKDDTTPRIIQDHNSGARLLDCREEELVK
ncbi:MAG: hypothetical protein IMZ61_14195 [Planctomycetes bacterium]|nr:hypothetical protein [Planctomycetota bacterium]